MLFRFVALFTASAALAGCANSAPTVDAGEDENALVGARFFFSPQGRDDDGDALTYQWKMTSQPSGSDAVLDDPTSGAASFVPDIEGEYSFEVVNNDGDATSEPDAITVTARIAPQARIAAIEDAVLPGTRVTLDGGESTVAEVGTLSYHWAIAALPKESKFTLDDASAAQAAQVEVIADAIGIYTLTLTVSDGEFEASKNVTFAARTPPVAKIVATELVFVGQPVSLDASESEIGPGGKASYRWAIASAPEASKAAIADLESATSSFIPDEPGTYEISLNVDDGAFASEVVTVTVTAVQR